MIRNQSTIAVTDKPVVMLWPDGAPNAVGDEDLDKPRLTVFEPETPTGTAVIVLPGGGYSKLAMGHEGMEVVAWLNEHGITAFLLQYRHGPRYLHPAPLEDAKRAMAIVRSRAAEWRIDPNQIGMLGFSAGGHLAASAAIYADKRDPIERVHTKPDFLLLVYPMISLIRPNAHRGTLVNLLGETPELADREALSLDLHVDEKTPPSFLVHTTVDRSVSAENSVLFYLALLHHGVPAELHIYEHGKHGRGLGKPELAYSTWPELCLRWLRARGVLPEKGIS
jgi:acetyl esterase/lipase